MHRACTFFFYPVLLSLVWLFLLHLIYICDRCHTQQVLVGLPLADRICVINELHLLFSQSIRSANREQRERNLSERIAKQDVVSFDASDGSPPVR